MKLKLRGFTFLAKNWQPLLLYGSLLAGFGLLLWWQLGTLTGGYSSAELQTMQDSLSLKHILEHPLNAPYTIVTSGLLRISDNSLLVLRLLSAVIGLATLGIFYGLVKYWHGERSAIFGTLLFGGSAWFLHTARLGTPAVLLFLLLALTACCVWIRHSKGPVPVLAGFLLATALVYVPGMIWFLAFGVIWQRQRIDHLFKRHLLAAGVGAVLVLAALAPLGWAIYQSPEIAKQLAGLPAHGWPQPLHALKALAEVPLNLFWRGPADTQIWLGRVPVLDAFSMAMFGLGAYLYAKHWRLGRAKVLVGTLIAGPVLIALGGGVGLTLIIPFIYILVAAGAGFMIDYWYRVFPRNIIAQAAGTVLISFAVAITCLYHLRHYYVAWPNAPATEAVFVVPDPRSGHLLE